ncbi:hypothetical protein PUMCH_004993 [Australozyma saopauloensis]|uniref:C2H2-type domain-containing protein n=1 Tax=Australozyma saopauloensis TaxID=291208 RepID=A0AAX4HHL2_9ASCO|nr:hypothetical protein PUMCH_004993 [[Candida] saopauloensis]
MAAPLKKYICTYCARAFTRSEHKQRHERSHTNEKPFHCLYCTSAFVRRDLLQRHCRTVHHIHRVSRKGLREKDSATSKLLPTPDYPPVLESQAKQRSSSESFESSKAQLSNREATHLECSVDSASSSSLRSGMEWPVSPPLSSGETQLRSSSLGDANLIASARVLLQLAPQKADVAELPSLNYLPRTPATSIVATSDLRSPKTLPRAHGSIAMLPRSSLQYQLTSAPGIELQYERLLSAAESIEQFFDKRHQDVSISDMFLLGFSILSESPLLLRSRYASFEPVYLNEYLQGTPLSDFDIGVGFTVSAIGATSMAGSSEKIREDSKMLINKAWTFLIEHLIPRHTLLENQLEVLKNLYLLAQTYLHYFGSDLMIGYLEDTTQAVLEKLSHSKDSIATEVMKPYMEIVWNIYIIVSKHRASSSPPKFYTWALSQTLEDYLSLSQIMLSFSKGSISMQQEFLVQIVACTFTNEVNKLASENSLAIFSSREDLNEALKTAQSSLIMAGSNTTKPDLFHLFSKKMQQNCPEQLKQHLKDRTCQISSPFQWEILAQTVREGFLGEKLFNFVSTYSNSLFETIANQLIDFMGAFARKEEYETKSIGRITALSTVSYSLALNGKLLRMKQFADLFDEVRLKKLDSVNLSSFVLEWFISLCSSLLSLFSSQIRFQLDRFISESQALQGLLHMTEAYLIHSGVTSTETIYQLYRNLAATAELWLSTNQDHFKDFRTHLTRFFDEVFLIAYTRDHFQLENVHLSNGSLLLKEKNEGANIGKERRSVSLSAPQKSSNFGSDQASIGGNYVLIKPKEALPSIVLPSLEKAPGATLPPFLGVSGVHLPQVSGLQGQFGHNIQSVSFLALKNPPFVLPPIQHSFKGNEQNDRALLN